MANEHNEHQEASNQKDKNSFLAAFGFVAIIIILIISAANYLRIQSPRFQPIGHTEEVEYKETTPAAVEKPATPAATQTPATPANQPPAATPQQSDSAASAH